MFKSIWRYIRAMTYMFTGRFNKMSDTLAENEHVMAATYDETIDSVKSNYQTSKTALAELIGLEKDLKREIEASKEEVAKLTGIKSGGLIKMQNVINTLRTQGKDKSQIESSEEFLSAKSAHESAAVKLANATATLQKKEEKLKERQAKIAAKKVSLQSMERTAQDLEAEKQEALADVASAKAEEASNARENAVSTTDTAKNLDKVRKARDRVINRAEVSTELQGNSVNSKDEELLALAQASTASKDLDSLLNWGDEPEKENLSPATLPES